ncbi:MAG: glutamyl-tRNA reductase [Cyanobacteria bacterium]|nr:glutamyl-tRNA reductase [Cyanobacteriota bacterium]MDW8199995.1 glutamyl-tRNA reductase [Cyanobacteriota bacterium SKYGB_h_bin112]
MNIAVVGLSHKTAPVEVREKLSIPEHQLGQAIAHLCSYPHVMEVAVLSTCNRLEIYCVVTETELGVREVTQFLAEHSKLPTQVLRPHLFVLLHQDAVMHVMRVASGLDSLVLGEGQILSQVKEAHKHGQKCNGVGRILNELFKCAIAAGKRVRTETGIGTGAVSISSAAVELAQQQVASLPAESLEFCRIAIIGAGKMSRLLVQHLLAKGAQWITILNRSIERANDLVTQFSGEHSHVSLRALPLTDMMTVVAESDLVFTSTAATEPILCRANLEPVLTRPLMLVDISVPRNVAGDVKDIAQVRAFDVDDLKAVVAQNQESRRQMAMAAEALLEEELTLFDAWWQSLETVPTINRLREKIETIRCQELEKALSRLGPEFGGKNQAVIEGLTKGIINKILHDPMVQLRAQRDIEARRRAMQALQTLFNLDLDSTEQYSQ